MGKSPLLFFVSVAVASFLTMGCGGPNFGASPLDLPDAQVLRFQQPAESQSARSIPEPPTPAGELPALPGLPSGEPVVASPPSPPAFAAAPVSKRAKNLSAAADDILAEWMTLDPFAEGKPIEWVMVDDTLLSGAAANDSAFPGGLGKRLRVELNRAANGKVYFVSRFLSKIEKQRNQAVAAWELQGAVADIPSPASEPDPSAHWRELTLSLVGSDSKEIAWQGRFRFRNGR